MDPALNTAGPDNSPAAKAEADREDRARWLSAGTTGVATLASLLVPGGEAAWALRPLVAGATGAVADIGAQKAEGNNGVDVGRALARGGQEGLTMGVGEAGAGLLGRLGNATFMDAVGAGKNALKRYPEVNQVIARERIPIAPREGLFGKIAQATDRMAGRTSSGAAAFNDPLAENEMYLNGILDKASASPGMSPGRPAGPPTVIPAKPAVRPHFTDKGLNMGSPAVPEQVIPGTPAVPPRPIPGTRYSVDDVLAGVDAEIKKLRRSSLPEDAADAVRLQERRDAFAARNPNGISPRALEETVQRSQKRALPTYTKDANGAPVSVATTPDEQIFHRTLARTGRDVLRKNVPGVAALKDESRGLINAQKVYQNIEATPTPRTNSLLDLPHSLQNAAKMTVARPDVQSRLGLLMSDPLTLSILRRSPQLLSNFGAVSDALNQGGNR